MDENRTGDQALESKPVILGPDGEFYNPLVDAATRSNVNMDLNHHEIHEGYHFYVSEYLTLASGETASLVLEVGDITPHFVFAIDSTAAGFSIQTYEDVAAAEDGDLIPINCNNRVAALKKDSLCVLRLNPTGIVYAGKTRLRNQIKGTGGNPAQSSAGSLNRGDEIPMEHNTKYLLRITNLGTVDNNVNYNFAWYEKNIVIGE